MDDEWSYAFAFLLLVVLIVIAGFVIWGLGANEVAKQVCITNGFDSGQWTDGEIVCTALSSLGGT